jgi:hypothetical protein
VVTMRASSARWAFFILLAGCATAPPAAAPDRFSPAEMQHGPSLHETGRIAVVPPSKGGLKVDEGAIDRPPPAPPLAGVAQHRPGKRRPRARAQRLP